MRRRLLAALLALAAGSARAARRPDVVLVSVDMMRADALEGAPKLSAFAARAEVFTGAHAHATYTVPSHLSMLTGKDPFELGASRNLPPRSKPRSVAQDLRGAGYQTAAFTEGYVDEPAFGQGFEVFESTGHDAVSPVTFAWAKAWLARRDKTRPAFVFVHTYHVHNHFRDAQGLRADPAPEFRADEPGLLERYRASYARAVRELDDAAGDFLASLSTDTVVILTGDHGENFGEPRRPGPAALGHDWPYESALRVPLVLSDPSRPRLAGTANPAVVGLKLVAATIREAAGLPPGGPTLYDPPKDAPHFFLGRHAPYCVFGVLSGKEKLFLTLRNAKQAVQPFYFDLSADPAEAQSLAEKAPARVAALKGLLKGAFGSVGWKDCGDPQWNHIDERTRRALKASGYLP